MWRVWLVVAFAVAAVGQELNLTLEGTVIDSVTKRPIQGAQVSIQPAGTAADVFTDASGAFRFEGLARGSYHVQVTRTGYRQFSQTRVTNGNGAGPRFEVKLAPLSELEGHVLDEEGHPMAAVQIYSGTNQFATTDAEGRYHTRNLMPGNYTLYCRLTLEARKKLLERDERTGEVRGYADTYYFPGVADAGQALPTTLIGGVNLSGADFRLRRVPLVEFSGRLVERSGGAPLTNAAVELDPGNLLIDKTWKRRNADAKGGFRFELIAPGRYTLLVYREGAANAGTQPFRVPVEIGPGGLHDAELRIPEYVNLTVNIVAPHPEKTQGGVMVSLGRAYGDGSKSVFMVRPPCIVGDKCVLRGVPPGEWSVDVQVATMRESGDAPRNLYLDAVHLGQQDAWGKTVMVTEGGNPPLEIQLTGDVGEISASVVGDDGKPAPAVLALQRVDGTEPMRHPNGYPVEGLRPGDYLVAAFKIDGDADTLRSASPQRCGDRAQTVTVTAGQTSQITLRPCVLQTP